ncbi:sulfite exporter TauE/SafE family protein [Dyadobacter sp. CY261]|uniref:sulfite exporter TauE/SafE family protein n=1 Tax=Dyadobacter sp. CY261 TaxID=2907203 RepID=UPI001F257D99|nr:sulfite exporter TauE/SafE family protein [Dyadobacter sp. CY261]MCF0071206.1 sulfite exporter TauE/SafE family protein [Dyadobacter sp. CY261]
MITALPYLALTMGLVSSFHCVGMCGPIALALPVHKGTRAQQITGILAYNAGRALTYATFGILIGTLGASLAWLGVLRYASVVVGVTMLGYVVWPAGLGERLHMPMFWQKAIGRAKQKMGLYLKKNDLPSMLLLGILNGAIPCGMVYIALMSSISTGSSWGGAVFMALFGLGTMPAMLALGIARQQFTPALRTRIRKLTPLLVAIAGIWLVVRGVMTTYPDHSKESAGITTCR